MTVPKHSALSTLLDRLPDLLTTDRTASLSALVDEAPRLVRGIETVPTMRDSLERHSARRPASYEGLLAYHASMPGEWTFLSNHGHVLVCLAGDPDARMRDVAELVGITERAVQQIVGDLVAQGYLTKEKVGRRNQYEVVRGAHLRHELEAHVTLGDFVGLVVDGEASVGRRRGPRSSR